MMSNKNHKSLYIRGDGSTFESNDKITNQMSNKLLTVEGIKQQESDCYDMENNYPKTGCNDCKHSKDCHTGSCEPEVLIKYAQRVEDQAKRIKELEDFKEQMSTPDGRQAFIIEQALAVCDE